VNRIRSAAPIRFAITLALLIAAVASSWAPGRARAEIGISPTGPYAWIAEEMVEIRGLPLLHEVNERHMSRAELRETVDAEWITEEENGAELEAGERTMTALGMLPEGSDLLTIWREAYGEGVGGYYDSDANEMVLITDSGEPDAITQIVYAHEFVHALTDQHFDLDALQTRVGQLDDAEAETALTALIEGDANAGQGEFMSRHDELVEEAMAAHEGDEDPGLPDVIMKSIGFPYNAGYYFVEDLRAEGGWEAVNAAYRNLPVSTEQILHPDLYRAGEIPARVEVPDLSGVLGQGWTLIDGDTLGEFDVELLLAEEEPQRVNRSPRQIRELLKQEHDPAAGSDGGRYGTWGNGSQTAIVWVSRWDTDTDALEFERAMSRYDAGRWGTEALSIPVRTVVDGDTWSSRIVRSGTRVIYVLAPSPELAEAMLAAAISGNA
jgi:hypothetical protein